ncbi:conserved exported hypothetical protein [Candidatus Accumulibacter aalborgensis]|uniref:Uncharacterized protein n=2 Tax=Candidatus Accumulibacter aalborgensis TaxID=1860102 RepID=A0A1A8XY63_9PROT|nr:conserved exported hypothetical protein [Candidatus Accumulibacter aalborgensis]
MLRTSLRKYLPGIALRRLTLASALMATASIATAMPDGITDEEMALIPIYCPYTQSFGKAAGGFRGAPSPLQKPWVAVMGDGFWAVHHYCWAQINLQRALRSSTTSQQRKHLLETVRADYGYVVKNSPKNFILLPELHTRLGEVEVRLVRYREADQSFAKARALKPDYWPAYSHWAEVLINAGKRAEAKQLVKTGLEYSPNSRVLIEQYRLLGGKPSEIVPKVRPKASESPPGEASTPAQPEEEALPDKAVNAAPPAVGTDE